MVILSRDDFRNETEEERELRLFFGEPTTGEKVLSGIKNVASYVANQLPQVDLQAIAEGKKTKIPVPRSFDLEYQKEQADKELSYFGIIKTKEQEELESFFGPQPDPSFKMQDIGGAAQTVVSGANKEFANILQTMFGMNPKLEKVDVPFVDEPVDLNKYLFPINRAGLKVIDFVNYMGAKGLQKAGIAHEGKELDKNAISKMIERELSTAQKQRTQFQLDHPMLGEVSENIGEYIPGLLLSKAAFAKQAGAYAQNLLMRKFSDPSSLVAPRNVKMIGDVIQRTSGVTVSKLLQGDFEEAALTAIEYPLSELGFRTSINILGNTIAAPFKGAGWAINKATKGRFYKWMDAERKTLEFIDNLIARNVDRAYDISSAKMKFINKADSLKDWVDILNKKGIKISVNEMDMAAKYFADYDNLISVVQSKYPRISREYIKGILHKFEKGQVILDYNMFNGKTIQTLIKARNETLDEIQKNIFLSGVKQTYGPETNIITKNSKLRRIFFNTLERMSDLDEQLNLGATDSVTSLMVGNNVRQNMNRALSSQFNKPIKKLLKMKEVINGKKLRYNEKDITRLLRYVDIDENGNTFWNPTADVANNVPKFKGIKPSDKALEELGKIRKVWHNIYKNNPDLFKDVGYINRYIPRMHKYSVQKIGAKEQDSLQYLMKPGVARERTRTDFLTKVEEDDIVNLVNKYTAQVSNHNGFKDVVPKLQKTLFKMDALGLTSEAKTLGDAATKAMGLSGRDELRKVSAATWAEAAEGDIEQLLKNMGLKPSFGEDVMRTVTKLMYEAFIGMNPKTILYKQPLQATWVGAGETGVTWVHKAQMALVSGRYKSLLKEMGPYLRAEELDIIETGFREASRKGLKHTGNILGYMGKGGMKVFDKLDLVNRQTSFLSGYLKLRDALAKSGTNYNKLSPQVLETIEHLLPGEKILVVDTLRKSGAEAASRKFGEIISRRVNYDYGIINKPMFLRGEFGSQIPFTTWGRNQFMRLVYDIKNKNAKQLAKRIAVPMAYVTAIKMLTGYDTTGDTPLMSTANIIPGVMLPAIQSASHTLQYRGPAAAATEIFRSVPHTKGVFELARTKSIAEKKGTGAAIAEGIFRMKEEGWLTDLMEVMGIKDE